MRHVWCALLPVLTGVLLPRAATAKNLTFSHTRFDCIGHATVHGADGAGLHVTGTGAGQWGQCYANVDVYKAADGLNHGAAGGLADFSNGWVEFPGPANSAGGSRSGYITYPFYCSARKAVQWKMSAITTDLNSYRVRLQVDGEGTANAWNVYVANSLTDQMVFKRGHLSPYIWVQPGQHHLYISELDDGIYFDQLSFGTQTLNDFCVWGDSSDLMREQRPVRINFELYVGGGTGGTGGDGVCASLGSNALAYYHIATATGISLCFEESASPAVKLYSNGAVVWEDLAADYPEVAYFMDSSWHDVELDILPRSNGGVFVSYKFDSEYRFDDLLVEQFNLPGPTYLGFTGRTSHGSLNNHWVRNIQYADDETAADAGLCWHFGDVPSIHNNSCSACTTTRQTGCSAATCTAGHAHMQSSIVDACGGSAAKVTHGDRISLLGGYSDNVECEWLVACVGGPVQVSFDSFDVELNFDIMTLYDGGESSAPQLARLTGNVISPLPYISTGDMMFLQFVSDGASPQSSVLRLHIRGLNIVV